VSDASSRAIVTGGGSGLGAALVVDLVRRGQRVVSVGRRRDALEAVASRVGTGHVDVEPCDLGDYAAVARLVHKTLDRGPVAQLFHAAGSPAFARPNQIDAALVEQALSANLYGLMYLSALLVDPMKKQGFGAIVGILSTTALTGRPDEAAYAAAKWGARGFLECLRADCKGTGVRVISVFPGGMNTPFWSKQSHVAPNLENWMDPVDVARPIVDAAMGVGPHGFISSLTIERK
jgi:uncharacterized protein